MPILNYRQLYHITIILIVIIAVFLVWRISVWHTNGYSGILYWAGAGEIVTVNGEETIDFTIPSTVSRIQRESPAEQTGIQIRDTVISVDGIYSIEGLRLYEHNKGVAPGDTITYVIQRDGAQQTYRIVLASPLRNTQLMVNFFSTLVLSILFFGIGLFILNKKPGDKRVLIFFLVCISTAILFIWASLATPEGMLGTGMPGDFYRYIMVWFAGMVFAYFAAVFLVHFSLIFPRERKLKVKHPSILRWMYVPPAMLCMLMLSLMAVGYVYLTYFKNIIIVSAHDFGHIATTLFTISFPVSQSAFLSFIGVIFISFAGMLSTVKQLKKEIKSGGIVRGLLGKPEYLVLFFYSTILLAGGVGISYVYLFLPELEISMLKYLIPAIGILLPILFLTALILISALVYPVFTIVNLYLSYRESDTEGKQQIRWPMWGIGTAIFGSLILSAPIVIEEFAAFRMSRATYYLLDASRIFVYALIPVSIVIAIIKYRLMDIEIIIKKTLTYSILSVIVVAVYLVLVLWIGGYIISALNIQTYWLTISATVAIAIAFIPLRNRIQNIIDRRFYRKKLDYNTSLKQLRDSFMNVTSIGTIESTFAENLQSALQSRMIFIAQMQKESSTLPVTAAIGLPEEFNKLNITSNDSLIIAQLETPTETGKIDLSAALTSQLNKVRCELLALVIIKNEATSIIGIGRKLNVSQFDEDDIDFIIRATEEFGRAIQELELRERDADYSLAREMQQALLPRSIPEIEKCTITASWHPARIVAGDYYDILRLGDQKAAICIADVVGKGMPAALLMSNLQALVRAYALENVPSGDLCNKINNVLWNNIPKGKFITFCVVIIDTALMELHYSNAGHSRPIILRSNNKLFTLEDAGPALGMMERFKYSQSTELLKSGDRIILYTDGITEAMNRDREEYGEGRLIGRIKENNKVDVRTLHDHIVSDVKTFSGNDLRDDVTMVVIEIQ